MLAQGLRITSVVGGFGSAVDWLTENRMLNIVESKTAKGLVTENINQVPFYPNRLLLPVIWWRWQVISDCSFHSLSDCGSVSQCSELEGALRSNTPLGNFPATLFYCEHHSVNRALSVNKSVFQDDWRYDHSLPLICVHASYHRGTLVLLTVYVCICAFVQFQGRYSDSVVKNKLVFEYVLALARTDKEKYLKVTYFSGLLLNVSVSVSVGRCLPAHSLIFVSVRNWLSFAGCHSCCRTFVSVKVHRVLPLCAQGYNDNRWAHTTGSSQVSYLLFAEKNK